MHLEKRDSLRLGLAHDGCALCFSVGILHFGSTQGEHHGGDIQNVRYDLSGSYLGIVWFNVSKRGHTSHPQFRLCFSGTERERGAAWV